ncbi:MAG: hypothetical protein CSA34_01415 [Desulfobulbus propionicus]|nr:MAG: hypothetical protein CSA34_01415 [Desulfobulbus propionicus]
MVSRIFSVLSVSTCGGVFVLRRMCEIFLVLGCLLIVTWLINLTNFDIRLSGFFYTPGQPWPPGAGWLGTEDAFWLFVYRWAGIPALLLAVSCLAVVFASAWYKQLRPHRAAALFLLILLIVGPGLVVNYILKDNLGRPRPQEIVSFGGKYPYTSAWQAGPAARNSSFPSGHASVAFYLMGPWFIWRRSRPTLARVGLASGLGYGCLVGTARILQGGHFVSDVLWAGGLVYLSGALLAMLFHFDDPADIVRSADTVA